VAAQPLTQILGAVTWRSDARGVIRGLLRWVFSLTLSLLFFKDFIGVGKREYSMIGWKEQVTFPLLGELDPWDGGMGRVLRRELTGRN